MRNRHPLVVLAILALCLSSLEAGAEGISGVSFSKDCLPLIGENKEVLAILSMFSIEDSGRCLNAMGPGESGIGRSFPMVFKAKLRGPAVAPSYYVIIDYMVASSLPVRILASAPAEHGVVGKRNLGVSLWPVAEP